MLTLHDVDNPLATLSDIHARYWACEQRLGLYCKLLDSLPAATAPVLAALSASGAAATLVAASGLTELSAAVDTAVLQLALAELEAQLRSSFESGTTVGYGRFCSAIDNCSAAVQSLLLATEAKALAEGGSAVVAACQESWDKLGLYNHFVRNISTPYTLGPELAIGLVDQLGPLQVRCTAAGMLAIPIAIDL